MCGIAGQFRGEGNVNTDLLKSMSTVLDHRGPDDGGIFTEGPIGLSHRRLSIIDPESGAQPLGNEDGSVVVSFNGEIYNYTELRDSLHTQHTFQTDTDTEVLVHLYEEHGAEFVSHLDGMFAFALWDANKEQLVLARDRMGIKPLYVHYPPEKDTAVTFASELSALLVPGVVEKEIDFEALGIYFKLGYIPAPKSIFKHVTKLQPGEQIVISSDNHKRWRYYEPSIDPFTGTFDDATRQLRQLVKQSVHRRLQSDVPLGAFLSGGIDSSVIVGVMSELMDEPVKTFTVGFEEDLFDESWAAREVAECYGTDHHEYTLSANDVREVVPSVIGSLGEPFADPSLIPTSIVSRETSRDVTVALSGDGADELFGGYNKYRGEYYAQHYRKLPSTIRTGVTASANALPASRGNRAGELMRKGQQFVSSAAQPDPTERHLDWVQIIDEEGEDVVRPVSPSVVTSDYLASERDRMSKALPDERHDSLSIMQATDSHSLLPSQMLTKVDRASMHHSLEVRVPFLDHRVVEFAQGLPTEYKINRDSRKRVLKAAFADMLPEEIQKREKQGFDMPISEWFKGPLRKSFIDSVAAIDRDLIDIEAVNKIFNAHLSGTRDYEWFLWALYVFGRWYDDINDC